MIEKLIIILHLLAALSVIALILLQQGKGADMGASFGSGGSQTVFGASGGGNVLTRATAILAAVFLATSLGLSFYAKRHASAVTDPDIPVIDAGAVAPQQKPQGDVPVQSSAPAVSANSDVPVQANSVAPVSGGAEQSATIVDEGSAENAPASAGDK